jgi:DNA-directed RNA polymerase specialized sigma24 family protein
MIKMTADTLAAKVREVLELIPMTDRRLSREDLLWPLFDRVREKLPEFDPSRAPLEAYIRGIAVFVIVEAQRRLDREQKGKVPLQATTEIADPLIQIVEHEEIEREGDRVVIELLYREANETQRRVLDILGAGKSRGEIGRVFGVKEDAVDQWIHRLRKKVIASLREMPNTEEYRRYFAPRQRTDRSFRSPGGLEQEIHPEIEKIRGEIEKVAEQQRTVDLLASSKAQPSEEIPIVGTEAWGRMNRRRVELIHKKNRQGLTDQERSEFERLQGLCHAALVKAFPRRDTIQEDLDRLRDHLRDQPGVGDA